MYAKTLLVAACFLAHSASAADKLNVKLGLWEIRTESTIGGIPPVPKEVLDKMTPQARAEMEAAFKHEAAQGPQVDVDRECITQRDLERPFETADAEDCKQSVVSTTATTQELRLTCTGKQKGSGVFKITTPTPETMTGVLDMKLGDGPEAMTVKSKLKGRWLGADCGDEGDDRDDDDVAHEDDTEEEEE
jgi:hypothetical protein